MQKFLRQNKITNSMSKYIDSQIFIKEQLRQKEKFRDRAIDKINSTTMEIIDGVIVKGNTNELSNIDIKNNKINLKLEHLYIKSNAFLVGNIEVNNAIIAGSFEGSMTVNEVLYLESNAVIKGKILYNSISNNGAKIIGVIKPIDKL